MSLEVPEERESHSKSPRSPRSRLRRKPDADDVNPKPKGDNYASRSKARHPPSEPGQEPSVQGGDKERSGSQVKDDRSASRRKIKQHHGQPGESSSHGEPARGDDNGRSGSRVKEDRPGSRSKHKQHPSEPGQDSSTTDDKEKTGSQVKEGRTGSRAKARHHTGESGQHASGSKEDRPGSRSRIRKNPDQPKSDAGVEINVVAPEAPSGSSAPSRLLPPSDSGSKLREPSQGSDAGSFVSASSEQGMAETKNDAIIEKQGYKQRRAQLLTEQRYRETMSYARRRETAMQAAAAVAKETHEQPKYLSFADFRKSVSYSARRQQGGSPAAQPAKFTPSPRII